MRAGALKMSALLFAASAATESVEASPLDENIEERHAGWRQLADQARIQLFHLRPHKWVNPKIMNTKFLLRSTKNMFKALDAGDRATVHAYGPTKDSRFPVQAFDYDWDNKPVAMDGVDAVRKYVDALLDEMVPTRLRGRAPKEPRTFILTNTFGF
jgi:hypothetical protein